MISRVFNVLLFTLLLLIVQFGYSQVVIPGGEIKPVTEINPIAEPLDSIENNTSTISEPLDTIPQSFDTIPNKPKETYTITVDKLECQVKRSSDSSRFIRATNVIEMYGNAKIEYCELILQADQINYNTDTGIAEAFGKRDSLGAVTEYAVFSDGTQEFQYDDLVFNFNTQKGIVKQLVTQQGEGVVRGDVVKKISEDESFILGTIYTTCNLDHPHYYFTFQKAKIKNDKFAAGKNLNLYIKDIPTPVYFPFAIFPLERGKRAGLLRIAPGYDRQRGFEIGNVGWYQPINDNMDALISSDFYTTGSWNVNTSFNYTQKYKSSMRFNFSYSKVKGEGISDALGVNLSNSFQLNYTFNQDPKVWPNANLNANISVGQSNFKTLNVYDPAERLNNNYTSSVSFNKTFPNLPVSFSSNLRYNQNTQSNAVSLTLPDVNLSTSTLYPFRGLSKPGKSNPFETLTLSYRSSIKNQVNTVDSIFFANPVAGIKDARFGATHSIPVSANFKLLKYLNLSPSFSYNEVWTSEITKQEWDPLLQEVRRDKLNEYRAARWYSTGLSLNTTVYGNKTFGPKSKINAIRHVMRPSIGMSYNPDFTGASSSAGPYFEEVQISEDGTTRMYSVFDGGLFGSPPSSSGGSVNFSLGNNIEMKVKSDKDSTGLKKVKIFESLNFNTSYNLKADSLNLSPIRFSGNTRLLDKFSVNVSGTLDPYLVSEQTGRTINQYRVKNGGFLDLTNASFRISGSLKSKPNENKQEAEAQLIPNPLYPNEQLFVDNFLGSYVDFSVPWNVSFNYNLSYRKNYRSIEGGPFLPESNLTNAVSTNLDFNLTDQWKVRGSTGYDFENNEINFTTLDLSRDLHCWQMGFSWSPVGTYKRYMFTISPKSSMLRDLKLEKKRTVYDNIP